jgi:hypothetical protein
LYPFVNWGTYWRIEGHAMIYHIRIYDIFEHDMIVFS